MIRWLHISDLHFGTAGTSTDMLRDELPKFLRKEGLNCDYVFCTGDIRTANAKPNDFTDEMADYLREICTAVGQKTDRLFIVPGNHDIDRDVDGRDEAIHRMMFQRKGYYDFKNGYVNDEDLVAIKEGEKDFVEFLSKILPTQRLAFYSNPQLPHFNIQTPHFNLLHLDTTISYTKGQEANDMIVGTKMLYDVVRNLNRSKPTIILTHYPFSALHQEEKSILSTMLQNNEIRLWLAGHEHEEILQRIRYIDSIQAGELKYENRAKATFLIGEYDPQASCGHIEAYSWFNEGWAKYPIVNLDNENPDRYDFKLKSLECPAAREVLKAKEANKEFISRLPEKVETSLLPAILDEDAITTLGDLLTETWNSDTPHIVLLADGGMGKTTMLLDYCRNSKSPILYIPVERLAALDFSIEQYCRNCIYDGDDRMMQNSLSSKYQKPTLTLFIDGLNEVDSDAENSFIREIQRLSYFKGLHILVASRTNFTLRHNISGYRQTTLRPLEDDQISGYISLSEWEHIKSSNSLHRLLGNPMMVTVYKEICSIIEDYRDEEFLDWILPVENATDLFHDYYVAQMALMMKRDSTDGKRLLFAAICIRDVLPAIAYKYECSHSLNRDNVEFRKILDEVLQNWELNQTAFISIQEKYREFSIPKLDILQVTDFLTSDLRLLYQDKKVKAFPHQMYRDYLSAQWIVIQSNKTDNIDVLWNSRAIPLSVMEHIRHSCGAYWQDGLANSVKKFGEYKGRDEETQLISNLLSCFPYSPISGLPDYSNLNLRGQLLPNNTPTESKIELNGAEIDSETLGLTFRDIKQYVNLSMSEDKAYLAASTMQDKSIYIFSLYEEKSPFVYKIGKKVASMKFCHNYLFVYAGSLTVFSFDGTKWNRTGEITNNEGSIIRNVKKMFVKDDVLFLYYNSRLVKYNLMDCSRVDITNGVFWKVPIVGDDISSLRRTSSLKIIQQGQEIVEEKGTPDFKAVSYNDGGLVIKSGEELILELHRGLTLLKDAAISVDGKRAVTLGYHVSNEKRKIQYWNLDSGKKISDSYCPQEVNTIHLSENGSWILGECENSTWVLNYRTQKEKWFNEHFVSNHDGRLVTYGNQVIRRDGDNLNFLNLDNGETNPLQCHVPRPKLVCFLPNGTLVAVDSTGYHLQFKSIRDNRIISISPNGQNIVSIQALNGQPFIAVFTEDQKIRLYHTGNGQCLRNEAAKSIAKRLVVHPIKTLMADTNGHRCLETRNYYEKKGYKGKRLGWWYDNSYKSKGHDIDGDILDIAFNEHNSQLILILSNGRIIFCDDQKCTYLDSFNIISAFDVKAYDFRNCVCTNLLRTQLIRNGALA